MGFAFVLDQGKVREEWVERSQPADPFSGLGDFEIASESFEMLQAREAERVWRERALAAEMSLRLIAAWLPAKKTPKKDLDKYVRMSREEALSRLGLEL